MAGRYSQLLSGHATIGPYLKGKARKTDSGKCWWCRGGQQNRYHLFTECRAWPPRARKMWKTMGKVCGWRQRKAPPVKYLWKDMATEAA